MESATSESEAAEQETLRTGRWHSRRLFRFSLRSLLLVVACLGIWLGVQTRRATRQRQAVHDLQEWQGPYSVFHSYGYRGHYDDGGSPMVPNWLIDTIGVDFFYPVTVARFDGTTDGDLSRLNSFPDLVGIHLDRSKLSCEGMQMVSQHAGIKSIYLRYSNVDDEVISCLRGPKTLEHLDLRDTAVTWQGLCNIRDVSIESVFLMGASIDDSVLCDASALRETRILGLNNTKVGNGLLAHIGNLTQLEALSLDGTEVTDAGLVALQGLARLRTLSLNDCRITDDGIKHIAALEGLRVIQLTSTDITGATLIELAALPQLESVLADLWVLDEESLKEFAEARPDVFVGDGR